MKRDLEVYQKGVQQQQPQAKEQTLTCSENSVFGKFDSFCSRLKKIMQLYQVLDKHDTLLKGRLQGLLQEEESESLDTLTFLLADSSCQDFIVIVIKRDRFFI